MAYIGVRRALLVKKKLPASGFTPTSAQSAAFLARATGITSNTDKTNYDTLITGLVNDSVFSKLDALYIFAAPDSTTAKLNLISTSFSPLSQTGSLTFTAATGYTGDGSTGFFDTGLNPATAGGNFVQDSAMQGCYVRTSRTVSQNYTAIGNFNNRDNRFQPLQAGAIDPSTLYSINDNAVASVDGTQSNAQGAWLATRTTSILTSLYKNGNATPTSTSASVSGALDSLNLFLFAFNSSGSASGFSADQMSSCWIGGGFTGTEAANLMTRVNTFMTAYGINVY